MHNPIWQEALPVLKAFFSEYNLRGLDHFRSIYLTALDVDSNIYIYGNDSEIGLRRSDGGLLCSCFKSAFDAGISFLSADGSAYLNDRYLSYCQSEISKSARIARSNPLEARRFSYLHQVFC